MSIAEMKCFTGDLQADAARRAKIDRQAQSAPEEPAAGVRLAGPILADGELDRVAGAAPASIDPSIASLLKPWVLP